MAEEENPFKPKHSLPAGEPEPAVAPAPSGGKTVDEIKAEKAAKLAEEEAKAKAALAAAAAEYSKEKKPGGEAVLDEMTPAKTTLKKK
ncbi:hypothetical protein KFE25_005481 [Diacronema lutheri]|uniref:Uncharacterized protein n=2 Tax=Diacronema lutheri TaxID=2081491 RepID=A0A8J5XC08_DIALT|nr:hypothetical protein KFE25_005481 [Diacronema lutheri]